jgi:hypothetical protein
LAACANAIVSAIACGGAPPEDVEISNVRQSCAAWSFAATDRQPSRHQRDRNGLRRPLGLAEGPVWIEEGGYLLFSDINASKRMKYTPGQGVTVFQENTNQANGLTRDLQGRIIACEHETRRVTD